MTLLMTTAGQDVTAATIERILGDPASPSGSPLTATGLRLDEDAIKASHVQALWLYAQMVAAGQIAYSDTLADAAAAVYEPSLGPPLPRPATTPAVFNAPAFSANDIPSYLAALEARHSSQ